jgi:hypothetical protein
VPSGLHPSETLLAPDDARAPRTSRPRALKWLVICGILLIAATMLVTGALIIHFHDRDLDDGERELANVARILAEQTDRTFEGLALIHTSLIDRMKALRIDSSEDFESRMSGRDVHLMLQDKISGLPHVSALALIAADDRPINSSRSWPPEQLNVGSGDVRSLASDPGSTSIVGEPVLDGPAGTWTASLIRKLTAADGRFLGMMLGTVELHRLEDFFAGMAFGQGRSIALLRNDGTLLARYPSADDVPGTKLPDGIAALGDRQAVATRTVSEKTGKERLVAFRRVAGYQLTFQCRHPPSMNWSSTSRRPRRLLLKCRRRCLPAPTR